ncbi:uncharacterized protein LOC131242494 [Magnolia sinica]|uniref:uncharacterized protein LOC131242494 n=1 Tax=Magnolia sinica TaxID=86752 RepID=UPI00265A042B|nr:uncharacterized protein LOC131242494 [Magnolia sinica]
MSEPTPLPLYKHRSWSPDTCREEAWLRRKGYKNRKGRSKSVTDEDVDELRACIELGFGFDSPQKDPRLSDTLPAYDLYYAVHKQYNESVSKPSLPPPYDASDAGTPNSIFHPGDNPQLVKTRLKQWAQVVACSVRQSS